MGWLSGALALAATLSVPVAGSRTEVAPQQANVARAGGVLAPGGGVVWAQLGGDVYRSTDGGRHFKADLPPAARTSRCGCQGPAFFLGTADAWVVRSVLRDQGSAQEARVWSTANGGRTWAVGSAVPGLPGPLSVAPLYYSLSFATPTIGYLLGSGAELGRGSSGEAPSPSPDNLVARLWETGNGGLTWHRVATVGLPEGAKVPPSPDVCNSTTWLILTFASSRLGFVSRSCQGGPDLWETRDAGQHWVKARFQSPPGGWPRDISFGLPTVTADGAVLDVASGLDPATDEGGWLVVERLGAGGSFRYVGRVQTDSLANTSLDAVDADGSQVAVLVEGRLPTNGDELFESGDGGVRWRRYIRGGRASPGFNEGPGPVLALLPGSLRTSPEGVLLDPDQPALQGQDDGGSLLWVGSRALWQRALAVGPAVPKAPTYDQVAFATPQVGYLAGLDQVGVTTDGGQRILPVLRLRGDEQVLGLETLGRSGAVVFTTRHLFITTDRGRRWRAGREPPGLSSAVPPEARFVVPQVGFASGCTRERATVETTVDAGRSWRSVPLPGLSGCRQQPAFCAASTTLVYYETPPSSPPGSAASVPLGATLYRSDDGGARWSRVGKAPDELLACSSSTIWADTVGTPAMNFVPYVLFRSCDGGRHFVAVAGSVARSAPSPGFGGPYRSMTLTAGDLGDLVPLGRDAAALVMGCWACQPGSDLSVSVTTDGGRHWSKPSYVLGAGLNYASVPASVSFVSPRFAVALAAWALGPGQLLASTNDGGRRWRELVVLGTG